MFTETDAPMKPAVMARRCARQHERPTLNPARGILRAEMDEHARDTEPAKHKKTPGIGPAFVDAQAAAIRGRMRPVNG